MQAEILDRINQKVYSQFPYLSNISPEITTADDDRFLLVYKGEAKTESGFTLPVIVRVVAKPDGEIVKLTASR